LKLAAKLSEIDAMLRGFVGADEEHGNVTAVTLLQKRIVVYIHFAKNGAKFSQQRCDGRFRLLAKMATGARVQRHVDGPRSAKAKIFRMLAHRFHTKVHLTESSRTVKAACIVRWQLFRDGRQEA
jgi:hypothetical protein